MARKSTPVFGPVSLVKYSIGALSAEPKVGTTVFTVKAHVGTSNQSITIPMNSDQQKQLSRVCQYIIQRSQNIRCVCILLKDIILEPSSVLHQSVSSDDQLFLQLIVDGKVEQTRIVDVVSAQPDWKVNDNIPIPTSIPFFTIAVAQETPHGHTRMLGSAEFNNGQILSWSLKQNFELAQDLGANLKFKSLFSISLCSLPITSNAEYSASTEAVQSTGNGSQEGLGTMDEIVRILLEMNQLIIHPIDFIHKDLGSYPIASMRPLLLCTLGDICLKLHDTTHDIEYLNWAISIYAGTVKLAPEHHPNKTIYLGDLGNSLIRRFELCGYLPDIDASVSMFEHAVRLTRDGHPNKPPLLTNLGSAMALRFERLGELTDIDMSIWMTEYAIRLTPDDHASKATRLSNLGSSLLRRFERLGERDDLDHSIQVKEEALQLIPSDHPNASLCRSNLGNSYFLRYEHLGELSDINKSISMSQDAVAHTPDKHPGRPGRLNNLGIALTRRFNGTGDFADIDKSIVLLQEAVDLTPEGHPRKPGYLSNLGDAYQSRFKHQADLPDINKSISLKHEAVRLTPHEHPDKAAFESSLGSSLGHRFEHLGNLIDADESIAAIERAVVLTPHDHPNRSRYLDDLGTALLNRFYYKGDLMDLENSITKAEDAVRLTQQDHARKPGYLNNLGIALQARFEQLGEVGDLERSISMIELALNTVPSIHPDRPRFLNNLANSLYCRCQSSGDLISIDRAISVVNEAIQILSHDHPDKRIYLGNLGTFYLHRHETFSQRTDLDNSVEKKEDAVRLTPDGHPDKPALLNNAGISYLRRFEALRIGDPSDLKQAITLLENAVKLTPDAHPRKPMFVYNLANIFFRQFVQAHDIIDINKSISFLELVVQLTSHDHANKPLFLGSLAKSLFYRYEQTGDTSDIERSITLFENALLLAPEGHPHKTGHLFELGVALLLSFERNSDRPTLNRAVSCLFSTAQSGVGSPTLRFRASLECVRALRHLQHTSSILDAYSAALANLPGVAWRGLPTHIRHRELASVGNVTIDAAATAIEFRKYAIAVEWLEQGRSIVWGQLLQLRNPVDELRMERPDLADQYTWLSAQLEQASARDDFEVKFGRHERSLEQAAQHHRRLAVEWENLLGKIRTVSGYEGFLQPKTLSQLNTTDCPGPIVMLNASKLRCDALILIQPGDDVLHVPLSNFSYQDAQRLHQSLSALVKRSGRSLPDRAGKVASGSGLRKDADTVLEGILLELWTRVVKPVLDALAFKPLNDSSPNLPRLWWCPNGPLAFLPIHAAGLYSSTEPGNRLSEFAVSSYIPTVSALISASRPVTTEIFQLLAVAQPSAAGYDSLPGTQEELDRIQRHATNLSVSCLLQSEATVGAVVQGMRESSWVHFACHGVQDSSDPTDSALLLAGNSRLKLSEIIQLLLPNANLAFLSACQTATGAKNLPEEAVHLANGMLLAGYRGVIATMWSIMDRDAPRIADDVYGYLFKAQQPDHTQAAHALHHAVQRLRIELGGKSFLSWVPFIHIGI